MRKPLVTVGLAVRNGEALLGEALESLAGQTHENLEILVGDNASTDDTPAICREFEARDPRVRYIPSARNLGAAWNFNRLVREARGRYFRWAAADDLALPELVARCAEVLEARPDVVLAYPKTRLIDGRGTPQAGYEDRLHLDQERPSERFRALQNRIGLCNAVFGLIRLDALRRTGLLGAFPGSDIVLLGELALHGRFYEVPERLFLRRFHHQAASAKDEGGVAAHLRGGEAPPVAPPEQYLRRWRLYPADLRAVARAPIPVGEKARTAGEVLRQARWNRNVLASELYEAARYWLRRARAAGRRAGGVRRELSSP